MRKFYKIFTALTVILIIFCLSVFSSSSDEGVVYLGDRQDLMLPRSYEDAIGWNTAHSGERITIWNLSFDKGIGFHCRQSGDAYIEFDISSLDMKYFSATVGVLKDATYYIDEGNISFRVYGDGKLLASTPAIGWNKKPYYICVPVEGVKTLRIVEDNEGTWVCDAGVWGDCALYKEEPTAPEWWTKLDPNNTDKAQEPDKVSGDFAYISDLYFKKYTGDAECRNTNTAGEKIVSFDDKYFAKGIGFHAGDGGYTVYIDVNIEGLGFTKFASYYGISQTVTHYDISMANIKFAVFGDGKKLFESGAVKYETPMEYMECDITGVKTLRLAIKGNPRIDGGWGTFGGAVISKSGNITDEMMYTDYFADLNKPTPTETSETLTPTPEETAEAGGTTPGSTADSTDTDNKTHIALPIGLSLLGAAVIAAAAILIIKKRKRG